MFSLRVNLVRLSAALLLITSNTDAQSVVSARAGVVHFFEGSVYIGDHRLERQFAKFESIPEGAELRTKQGRVEILLSPGVILRIGENSAIRMVASDLANTRVDLLNGSGILEVTDARPENSVTIAYKSWQMQFLRPGVYRMDCEPPRLSVQQGEAQVSTDEKTTAVAVKAAQTLPFAEVLVPEQSSPEIPDLLSDWTADRSQAITTDNAIAAQITDDPAAGNGIDPGLTYGTALAAGGFTYFPRLGLTVSGTSLFNPYGYGWNPYSIYMPGYLYSGYPGGFGYIRGPRLPSPIGSPERGGVITGPYTPAPRTPVTHSPAPHSPAPVHLPAPHVGGHR